MEETVKRRHKRTKKRHHAESPDGAKPSKFWKKLSRPWKKLARAVLPAGAGSRKRAEEQPREAPASGWKIPRLVTLLPILGAGILLSLYLRSCNSAEVVIEENAETIKVRQMMNQVVQQQQQNDVSTGMVQAPPPPGPSPGAPAAAAPPAAP